MNKFDEVHLQIKDIHINRDMPNFLTVLDLLVSHTKDVR